jgi:DNA-binding response OmpR family regulator
MSLRVLLTDADPVLLSVYRAFLVDQRIAVRTACNAFECLDELRRWRPDVLVLDADLPGGSGLDVLGVMNEDVTVPVIPVLLLSKGGPSADLDVAIRDYALMIKPVPATVLADIIRTLADSGWGDKPRPDDCDVLLADPSPKRGKYFQPHSRREDNLPVRSLPETNEQKELVAKGQVVDLRPRLAHPGGRRLDRLERREAPDRGAGNSP